MTIPSDQIATAIRAHHGADLAITAYADSGHPEELDAAITAARRVLASLRTERNRVRASLTPSRDHA